MTVTQANPQNILAKIVQQKEQEIAQMVQQQPIANLQKQAIASPKPRDFLGALKNSPSYPSLIAEVKKASPSKGVIRADFDPAQIAKAYEKGGAACLSVLTDSQFFQGSFDNLRLVRQNVNLPLLCKEFIIDPYQVYLARASGADAVLLIAAILPDNTLWELLHLIQSLGMEALVEVHTLAELDRVLSSQVRLVGINNRDLDTFTVDLATTQQLMVSRRQQLHCLGITTVSESGLFTPDDLSLVAKAGVRSVLVGESLVKQPDIEQAVQILLK